MVLIPLVEGSVPVTEVGSSSARRKPVCTSVLEGAKMDLSLRMSAQLTCTSERTKLYCDFDGFGTVGIELVIFSES